MTATTNSITFSTSIVHVGSGASVASGGGISGSADISTALAGSGNLGRYPLADIQLSIVPTASMSSVSNTVLLYKRNMNLMDGAPDEQPPGTSNQPVAAGVFRFPGSSASFSGGFVALAANIDVSAGDCEFYLNNQTNYNIPAGWTLVVRPKADAFA